MFKTKKKEPQVGDKIEMYFRFMGIVSKEDVTITAIDEKTVTIDSTWHSDVSGNEENGKFNRKNGKCLNDCTNLGASRYITAL